jgi:hypothetical protein
VKISIVRLYSRIFYYPKANPIPDPHVAALFPTIFVPGRSESPDPGILWEKLHQEMEAKGNLGLAEELDLVKKMGNLSTIKHHLTDEE